jgi:BMFP domain-containing protein YqiC
LGNVESATIGAAGATGKLAAGAVEATGAVSGVGTAAAVIGEVIGTAFSAGIIFLFIEALFHGISALEDLEAKAKAISDAWDKVDAVQKKVFEGLENSLLKAQLKTAELTDNQMEALRLKLQLIDNVTLENLENEIKKVAAEAEKAFKDIQPGLIQRLYGFDATGEVGSKFQEISKSVEEALSPHSASLHASARPARCGTLKDSGKD